MQTKNSHMAKNHVIGDTYKLWNLPVKSVVARPNFKVKGQDVITFKIIEQTGNISYCKTSWGEIFCLDASLEASLIKFN